MIGIRETERSGMVYHTRLRPAGVLLKNSCVTNSIKMSQYEPVFA